MLLPMLLLLFAVNPKGKTGLPTPPPTELRVSSIKELGVPFFGFWGRPQSDSDGVVYFHAATSDYNNSTILGIPPDGSQPLVYSIKGEFATRESFEQFHVTPSGKVYILTSNADHFASVFEFDHDGSVNDPITLDIPVGVIAESFAVFERNGALLIWGYYGDRARREERGRPFSALLDSSGKLVHRLSEGKKRELKDVSERPSSACAFLSDDGYMYALNSEEVLAVSETGAVQRRIRIKKPHDNDVPTKLVVSQGLLAIWLDSEPAVGKEIQLSFETIDLSTGKIHGVYVPSEELGNNAVSFTRTDGFVFFKNVHHRINVMTASAP